MARGSNKPTDQPSVTDVNEKVKQLQPDQLRMVIVLMVSGKSFTEAYEVALTFTTATTE